MRRFDNVNILRALAALGVLGYHVIQLAHWESFPRAGPLVAMRIGWMGLDLFFVISGFVVVYSALALYRASPEGFARAYWTRRIARIAPLHYLTIAIWLAFVSHAIFTQSAGSWLWQLFTHALFIHDWWPETAGAINGINWTLAVEMQFYFAIALLLPWIDRTPGWRIWIYGTLVAWAWRACMLVQFGGEADTWAVVMHASQLPGQLDEFCAGIFLAKWVLDGRLLERARGTVMALAACVAGTVAMAIYWPHAAYWDFPFMTIFFRTVLGIFFMLVVAAAVTLPQGIARALRPLAYAGEISYGIYLFQLIAIVSLLALGLRDPLLVLAATLATVLTASALSWRFFERPILRLAHRATSTRQERRSALQPQLAENSRQWDASCPPTNARKSEIS